MNPLLITPILEIGGKLIDKLFPDPAARDAAKLELLRQQQAGELQELQTRMSVMLAEAQSADGYTSRARPSMLYVWYILLLTAIPMGLISAVSPSTAADIANGFGSWLRAIPDSIVDASTFVLLGYVGGRSLEKIKGAAT